MGEEGAKTPDGTIKKKVDESWKDSIAKEKEVVRPKPAAEEPLSPESSFSYFISTLGMQAYAALGEIENPMTGQKHVDPAGAKYLIDTLRLLAEKTRGNLTPDEETSFQELLYDLQVKFVQKSKS